jgi:hypothetical protein
MQLIMTLTKLCSLMSVQDAVTVICNIEEWQWLAYPMAPVCRVGYPEELRGGRKCGKGMERKAGEM